MQENLNRLDTEIQEILEAIDHKRQEKCSLKGPEDLQKLENEIAELTDRLHAAMVGEAMQSAVDSEEMRNEAKEIVNAMPKRMKNQGAREVELRTLRGMVVIFVPYFTRAGVARNNVRRRGLYPALCLLGVNDRCTPALSARIGILAAALGSFEEVKLLLAEQGIDLCVNTIRDIVYNQAARARAAQRAGASFMGPGVGGRRVVVSTDGGRIRIRKDKRGKRTKKGRKRYSTKWREPKLLIIYVVDEEGRMDRQFAPILDGTLRGPDEVFAMIRYYLEQLSIREADQVLFVADGARWIWTRVAPMMRSLGLKPEQVRELVDFYHAVEHLAKAADTKKRWQKGSRKRWINKQRKRLLKGQIEEVVEVIRALGNGRSSKKLKTELGYFVRNGLEAKRMDYAACLEDKLPIGSGAMESAIRRVINLRLKGASIYWHEDSAEAMLLLRCYYKAGRSEQLHKQALTSPYVLAL